MSPAVLTYLQEGAHHMISQHGENGPAFAEHMDGVDRHDNKVLLGSPRHEDADPAGAQAHGIVGQSRKNRPKYCEDGAQGRQVGLWTHLGPCCSSK